MAQMNLTTKQKQTHRCREQNCGCQGLGGGGNGELVFNGYKISVQDDEKVLEMDGGDG